MQKITPKYMLWKIVICFLTQLMASAIGIPFVMVAKANGVDGKLIATLLSIFSFSTAS